MLRNTEEVTDARMSEIERLVNEFREVLINGLSDDNSSMKINEIEELWTKLRTGTDKVYADMLGEYFALVDEREVIREKKTNTGQKE